jgi:hypothetical protein
LPYPGEAEAIAGRPFTAGHPDGLPPGINFDGRNAGFSFTGMTARRRPLRANNAHEPIARAKRPAIANCMCQTRAGGNDRNGSDGSEKS